MKNYEVVIGLEVHVQLATESKIFCGCSAKFGLEPNSATCPVCLGLPGALPVLNEKAFLYGLKTALALNCKISGLIKFDRKNYFYPDLPKNFQISQYDRPLASKGFAEIDVNGKRKRIGVTRVHLEEDAGRLIHDPKTNESYADFNRAGIPLLEIVSEPDIRSPEEASIYMEGLRAILLYLGVSDCSMEEGSLRCDANISVRRGREEPLGVKTELKNMNSFKAVRDALSYESARQIELLENKERVAQETRLWNEAKAVTAPMRTKEEAHDYRYFPEPDLVPFELDGKTIEKMRRELPELPEAKKSRFIYEYGLGEYDSDMLTRDMNTADFFEETVRKINRPKEAANWLFGDVASILNRKKTRLADTRFKPAHLAELISMICSEEINGKIAKDILPEIFETGMSPAEIAGKKGMKQVKDDREIARIAREAVKENRKSAGDYKNGKKGALMFLVGQVMKKTKGKANPKMVNEILKKILEEDRTP